MSTASEHIEKIRGWLTGRLPGTGSRAPPRCCSTARRSPSSARSPHPTTADGASEAEQAAAVAGRVKEFRERTREQRITIARELEHRTGRKVAWGVQVGERRELFTTLSVPVMTRLRQPERLVLDTLVDAGVARSRSEALAWCVKLVGKNTDGWLGDLREAMEQVRQVRAEGPDA